jgi:type I restriction enzyme M protein
VDWKKIEKDIKDENAIKGFDGRFGPGLPRVSDGSLLFLMHLISKLRDSDKGGARIGIILNGSPLFTGGAGSGESEIRRHILESDLLEAIVALPTDMFYNTGISTYVWVLANKKDPSRKGKVQLINGTDLYSKMRKSLGSKRKWMDEGDIATITRCFGNFEVVAAEMLDKPSDAKSNRGRQASTPKLETPKTFASKIFDSHEFGYRRLTIERPLRESYQFSDDRIATLRFMPRPLTAISEWVYDSFGNDWDEDGTDYGVVADQEVEIRTYIKAEFPELKEKQIKDVLDSKTWRAQLMILQTARALQAKIGTDQHDDMNGFDRVLKATGIGLDATAKKQITAAVSWKNPNAQKVIKKVHKNAPANPLYGLFSVDGKAVEYMPDSDLRDNENVPLDPSQPVNAVNEAYFKAEVAPHVPDAWIDASKLDAIDGEIGIVGYEIPFNRHFYTYTPPRDLAEIDAELDSISSEIMALLQEVHT